MVWMTVSVVPSITDTDLSEPLLTYTVCEVGSTAIPCGYWPTVMVWVTGSVVSSITDTVLFSELVT